MLKTCQFTAIYCSLTLYLSIMLQRMASTSYSIGQVRDKLFDSSDADDDDLSDSNSDFESEETQTHDDDQGPTTNDNILSSEDSDSEIEIRNNAEIDDDDDVAPPLSKRRRFPPREKLICNLEATLVENNYELMNVIANQAKCIYGKLERGNKSEPERTIKWQNKPPTSVGRQSISNIILGSPGVRNEFKDRLPPKAAWELFFI